MSSRAENQAPDPTVPQQSAVGAAQESERPPNPLTAQSSARVREAAVSPPQRPAGEGQPDQTSAWSRYIGTPITAPTMPERATPTEPVMQPAPARSEYATAQFGGQAQSDSFGGPPAQEQPPITQNRSPQMTGFG